MKDQKIVTYRPLQTEDYEISDMCMCCEKNRPTQVRHTEIYHEYWWQECQYEPASLTADVYEYDSVECDVCAKMTDEQHEDYLKYKDRVETCLAFMKEIEDRPGDPLYTIPF